MIRLRTRGKLLSLMITTILILIIAVNIIIYFQFSSYITNNMLRTNINLSMQLLEQEYQGDWRLEGDKLFKGNKLFNEDFQLVDNIKKLANVECTVFAGDTRIATTITENGNRAVGTKAQSNVVDMVINKGETYLGSTSVLDVPFETIYMPIKDDKGSNIGMFFVGIQKSVIAQQVNSIVLRIIAFTAILILISALALLFISTKIIINPVNYIKNHLQLLATGDLTTEIEPSYLNKSDEFGDMCKSAKIMQDSIKTMITNIKANSKNIDDEAENLASVAVEMAASSESVATSIEEVACGTATQSENLMNNTELVEKFGNELDEMVNSIENINSTTKNVDIMAKESNEKMQTLIQSITSVSTSFESFMKKITEFKVNITQINEIAELINSISDQTNLLALNASIEAARAGEAGRGFAVVADEIRKLADQSKKSVTSINTLIEVISQNTGVMTTTSNIVGRELENQVKFIYETIESFNEIVNEVEIIIPKVSEVSTSIESMSKEKNVILENIEKTSSIAKEFSVSTEEIVASSQEMNASTEEVSSASNKLSDMTKQIMHQIEEFKL
jgi:methyl-accepting chemotaxis protein